MAPRLDVFVAAIDGAAVVVIVAAVVLPVPARPRLLRSTSSARAYPWATTIRSGRRRSHAFSTARVCTSPTRRQQQPLQPRGWPEDACISIYMEAIHRRLQLAIHGEYVALHIQLLNHTPRSRILSRTSWNRGCYIWKAPGMGSRRSCFVRWAL
jgi:hypothetical protein